MTGSQNKSLPAQNTGHLINLTLYENVKYP